MCGVCSAFHVPRSVVSIAGWDLNPRPPGYEPGELPDCSTPRRHGRTVERSDSRTETCACRVSLSPTVRPSVCPTGRAGNGTRTRDPNLGKVLLYQLSYSRVTARI